MVRFGIQVRQEGLSFDVIRRYFKDFERLDFHSAFVNDHFHLERKLRILKNYCADIGRDYERIEKSWLGHLIIGSNETEASQELKRMSRVGKVVDSGGLKGFALVGSPREIINQIEGYLKMGIDYFIIRLASESFDFISRNSLKLFSEKVMAAFK